MNYRWKILLKNEKSYLHVILFKLVCSSVFWNWTTLKGELECIPVVMIVGVEMRGAKAVIDAVVEIVGRWRILTLACGKRWQRKYWWCSKMPAVYSMSGELASSYFRMSFSRQKLQVQAISRGDPLCYLSKFTPGKWISCGRQFVFWYFILRYYPDTSGSYPGKKSNILYWCYRRPPSLKTTRDVFSYPRPVTSPAFLISAHRSIRSYQPDFISGNWVHTLGIRLPSSSGILFCKYELTIYNK